MTTHQTRAAGERTGVRIAIAATMIVWLLASIMNFGEQYEWAVSTGNPVPYLVPLVLDGLYVSLATVSLVASLDGRAAIPARLATLLAVVGSAALSANAARVRTTVDDPNSYVAGETVYRLDAVLFACSVVPVAFIAFEVCLGEIRRQVQKDRGRVSPVPVPYPRAVRWALSPFATARKWRRVVLALTDREMIVPDGTAVSVPEPVETVPVQVIAVSDVPEPETETTVSETVTRSVTTRHGRRSVSDEEYVESARRAVSLMRERGQEVTRDGFIAAMKELESGVGTVRAARLLAREDVLNG